MRDGFKIMIEWTEQGVRTIHKAKHEDTEDSNCAPAFPSELARTVEAVIPRAAAVLAEAITELDDDDDKFFQAELFNLNKACRDYLAAWEAHDEDLERRMGVNP